MRHAHLTRRDFLSAALLLPAAFQRGIPGDARLIGTVPLGTPNGALTPPFGRLLGSGLDARLFTDLSVLSPDRPETLVTPADQFFVRTAFPSALQHTEPWTIAVEGLVRAPKRLSLRTLQPLVAHGGRYLMECSGNVDQSNYGLMSAGDWDGVPLRAVLERAQPSAASHRILVSGADDEASAGRTSVPGASWIFAAGDLERALLATRLNGAPLPRDHGFPVRLIVPGWYGCACIKWVNRIEVVRDDADATVQMREFAARTHQPFDSREMSGSLRASPIDLPDAASSLRAVAQLARDYIPAVIDTAAMPIRIEHWAAAGTSFYRVVGIVWGGSKPTNALSIRFKSGEPWIRVDDCPLPASTLTWSIWSHTWRPAAPGRYQIVLRVDDASIRTRRLDLFFYVREVLIDEI